MLKLTSTEPHRIVTETLIIPVCQDKEIHHSPIIRTLVRQALGIDTFQGENGEELSLHQPADIKAKRVLFIGLGPHAELTPERFRQAAGKGVRLAMHAAKGDAVLALPDGETGDNLAREDLLAAMAEGALLSNHCPTPYKSEQKIQALKTIRLHTDATMARRSRAALKRIDAICRGTLQARDWINQPANEKTPDQLARRMAQAARRHGVNATILNEKKRVFKGRQS